MESVLNPQNERKKCAQGRLFAAALRSIKLQPPAKECTKILSNDRISQHVEPESLSAEKLSASVTHASVKPANSLKNKRTESHYSGNNEDKKVKKIDGLLSEKIKQDMGKKKRVKIPNQRTMHLDDFNKTVSVTVKFAQDDVSIKSSAVSGNSYAKVLRKKEKGFEMPIKRNPAYNESTIKTTSNQTQPMCLLITSSPKVVDTKVAAKLHSDTITCPKISPSKPEPPKQDRPPNRIEPEWRPNLPSNSSSSSSSSSLVASTSTTTTTTTATTPAKSIPWEDKSFLHAGKPCQYPDGRPKVGPGTFNYWDIYCNPGKTQTNFDKDEKMYEDLREFYFLFDDDPETIKKAQENPTNYVEAMHAWLERVNKKEPESKPWVDPTDRFVLLKKFQSPNNDATKLWIKKNLCVYLDDKFLKNCQKWFPNCLLCKIFDKNSMSRFNSTLTQRPDGSYNIYADISPGHWGIILNYLETKNLIYKLTTYPDALELAFSLDFLNIELCLGGMKIIYDLIPYFRMAEHEERSRIQYYFQTLPEMFHSNEIIYTIATVGVCPKFGRMPDIVQEIKHGYLAATPYKNSHQQTMEWNQLKPPIKKGDKP